MAKKKANKQQRRIGSSLLAKLLILALLAGIGWQLYTLRARVAGAQAEKERLAAQVEAQKQENDALKLDITAGSTPEKMEQLARDELGMVAPGEYVFYTN